MRFMNRYDIGEARRRYQHHPILGPATHTLKSIMMAADANSDGWAYWPKPARAAAKLMELIERDGTAKYRFDDDRPDVTVDEYRKALRPIKAFRTRTGIPFEIYDVDEHADFHERSNVPMPAPNVCSQCKANASNRPDVDDTRGQQADPGSTYIGDNFGYGTLDELAQVLADRTDIDVGEVTRKMVAYGPEALWEGIVGPMLDDMEATLELG